MKVEPPLRIALSTLVYETRLGAGWRQMVLQEVVATSSCPGKSRVPIYCSFWSIKWSVMRYLQPLYCQFGRLVAIYFAI